MYRVIRNYKAKSVRELILGVKIYSRSSIKSKSSYVRKRFVLELHLANYFLMISALRMKRSRTVILGTKIKNNSDYISLVPKQLNNIYSKTVSRVISEITI